MDKNTYKRYLRTRHWQQLRQEVLRRADGQVHHLTYSNVGNEKLDDLIVVCPRCHMELHGITGRRKPENMKKNN